MKRPLVPVALLYVGGILVALLIRDYSPRDFFAGQEVEITGVAGPPNKPAAAEGTFDYRA
jgi:hypothetical protein